MAKKSEKSKKAEPAPCPAGVPHEFSLGRCLRCGERE